QKVRITALARTIDNSTLTRMRRTFVRKGECFFTYRNDSRYHPMTTRLAKSRNFGLGSFDQPKQLISQRPASYFHSQYSECVLPSGSTSYSNNSATLFSRDKRVGVV